MAHDPADPKTWPSDLCGYRADTDSIVFNCACRCGGHVLIKRKNAVCVDVLRHKSVTERKVGAAGKRVALFGTGYFITGHEPGGIACPNARVGKRTQLRATT